FSTATPRASSTTFPTQGNSLERTCCFCYLRGHTAHAYPSRTYNNLESHPGKCTALAAVKIDGLDEWVADSGATWHMTNDAAGMTDFVNLSPDTLVEAANGDKCHVAEEGN
ncbi:unnamed protein product, partial [Discosporangium mesarthrocarpum]